MHLCNSFLFVCFILFCFLRLWVSVTLGGSCNVADRDICYSSLKLPPKLTAMEKSIPAHACHDTKGSHRPCIFTGEGKARESDLDKTQDTIWLIPEIWFPLTALHLLLGISCHANKDLLLQNSRRQGEIRGISKCLG